MDQKNNPFPDQNKKLNFQLNQFKQAANINPNNNINRVNLPQNNTNFYNHQTNQPPILHLNPSNPINKSNYSLNY
jgi:hypothetical protein